MLMTIGCQLHNTYEDFPVSPGPWDSLTIRSEENTVISINNDDDTSTVKVYHAGTIFSPPPPGKIKVDTLKVYFTKAEKDTLFSLSKTIISTPIDKRFSRCTDFVGDLEITINYGPFKQTGEYTGVCNWNKLSEKTMQLHDILRRKIKHIYLGEGDAAISHVGD